MSRFGVLAAICLTACEAGGGPGPSPSCQGLYDQFQTVGSQVTRHCDYDGDCVMAGGQPEGDYCDCTATLAEFAVNGAAYQGSEAQQLADEFYAQCNGDPYAPSVCDRGPSYASCIDHICQAYGGESCFITDAAVSTD